MANYTWISRQIPEILKLPGVTEDFGWTAPFRPEFNRFQILEQIDDGINGSAAAAFTQSPLRKGADKYLTALKIEGILAPA